MKNAQKLIQEINKKKDNWDERSQFKFGKIGNLSVSDLDMMELYAETFLRTGSINGLMEPRGGVGEVLAMHGIEKKGFGW